MRGLTLIQRKTAPVRGQRPEAAGNARRRRRAGRPLGHSERRLTTTSAGRQAASDGVTVELTRSGRWLVSAVLFY